jgi:aspartokinase/homoserine dehydrogenase 1
MIVIKFGGTSIGTPERFLNVSKIISSKVKSENAIIVLSAIGGITDDLLDTIGSASRGDAGYLSVFEKIRSVHYDFLARLIPPRFLSEASDKTESILIRLEEKLNGVFLLNECSSRISDSIITGGEYLSNNLLVYLLRSRGINCCFYDAADLIRTDSNHGDARVNFPVTNALLQKWYSDLDKNIIAIVNGFTGSDDHRHITTLGRSGSDFTATIIGGALKADLVEIWTDVDGVLTVDPKIVPAAETLNALNYSEASSLAVLGGKVIHPKTIYPVERQNVPVNIRNTFRPDVEGTYIGSLKIESEFGIKTITYLKGLSSITIYESESKYGHKLLARLFGLLARLDIPIITIGKSAYNQTISLIVKNDYRELFLENIKMEFMLEIENGIIGEIRSKSDLAIVSAIGVNANNIPHISRKIYDVLENGGVNEINFLNDPASLNISFVVEENYVNKTISDLHEEFFSKPEKVFVSGILKENLK